jgi:methylamine utilization protein MauE
VALMAAVVLACKAAVAVLLTAAGGAKLADLTGFAASVRLFWPGRLAPARLLAVSAGLAGGEVAAGAASLSSPRAGWLNLVVLAICGGFVATAAVGYARHPGRPCRCFGGLSRRGFNAAGIATAMIIAACAAVAMIPVRPALTQLGASGRFGLLAGATLVAVAAYTAAAAVGAGQAGQPRRPGSPRAGSRRTGVPARWA